MSVLTDSCLKVSATEARESSGTFFYGWMMVPLSMLALVASSPGQTFGVSIFNEPMRLSLGLSYGELTAAYMIGTLIGALPITFVGSMMDRHGGRLTTLVTLSLFCLACLFTSLVHGWFTLMIAFTLLRMLGPGALGFASGNTLPYWFERRLGMVEGIRQFGMAVAMLFIPAINLALLARWGWRGSYAVLGVAIWCAAFPLFWTAFRNRPEDVGQRLDGASAEAHDKLPADFWWGLTLEQAGRTFSFWVVAIGSASFSLVHTAIFFCVVPIFHERGLTDQDAAYALTAFAGSLAILQLVGGTLADHLPSRYLLACGLFGMGCGVFLLQGTESAVTATVATAILGAAQGIFFGAAQPLWARYFGRRHLGKIRGVLATMNVASSSLGPLVAGVTHDVTGDFGVSLFAFAIIPLPIALMSLWATPPKRGAEETAEEPVHTVKLPSRTQLPHDVAPRHARSA
jgi:MFS family permease